MITDPKEFARMQQAFEEQSNFYFCGETPLERRHNWDVWKQAWEMAIQQPKQQ